MKKRLNILFAVVLALFAFGGQSILAASNIADDDHKVNITTLEANSDSESIAGSFMDKTATLSIDGDNATITLGVAKGGEGEGEFGDFDFSIEWVTVEGKSHASESDGDDVTYYTFPLDEVKEILNAKMEYKVPGFPGMEDGHEVGFRIQLDNLDDLPKADEGNGDEENDNGSDEDNGDDENGNGSDDDNGNDDDGNGNGANEDNGDDDNNGNGEENDQGKGVNDDQNNKEDNPKTGDTSNILLYVVLMIGAAGLIAYQLRRKRLV